MDREMLAASAAFTAGTLREQIAQMTAASQVLSRIVSDEKGRSYLAVMNKNICCMLRTVGRMELAHRLVDENEIRIFPEDMELAGWMDELGRSLQSTLECANISFRYECPSTLISCVDGALLRQMLLELVSHAASSGKNVSLSLSLQGKNLCFKIHSDASIGNLPRLFDSSDVTEESYGISIAMQIAELHGGTMMVSSGSDNGSSVTVLIPVQAGRATGRLESPYEKWDQGGFDPVMIAMSDLLPADVFAQESFE